MGEQQRNQTTDVMTIDAISEAAIHEVVEAWAESPNGSAKAYFTADVLTKYAPVLIAATHEVVRLQAEVVRLTAQVERQGDLSAAWLENYLTARKEIDRLRAEMGDLATELMGANAENDWVTACCRWAEAEVERLTVEEAVPDGVVVIDGRRWWLEVGSNTPGMTRPTLYRLIPATEGAD